MAVRAYYTPETSQKYPTKKAAAQAHGVSACAPLFATYEKQLRQTPDVMAMITNGEMPPEPPKLIEELVLVPVTPPTAAQTTAADWLRSLLQSRCTRLGDRAIYGQHGTIGMYREGLKWALLAMKSQLLPQDGWPASTLLEEAGVKVGRMNLQSARF